MLEKIKNFLQGLFGKNVAETTASSVDNQVYETMRDTKYEYPAVIESIGGGYKGFIVDIPADRGTTPPCSSTQEVMEKLTELMNAEFELCKRLNQPFPNRTPIEKVKKKYWSSSYSVVTIYPKKLS